MSRGPQEGAGTDLLGSVSQQDNWGGVPGAQTVPEGILTLR